jgi:hypothetical protein
VIERERLALASSTARTAIDDLWAWLASEIERGQLRVLVELAEWREDLVQREIEVAMRLRREATLDSTARLFALLALTPKVPLEMIAETVFAFRDGLVIVAARDSNANPRAAFDVFWLALLCLAD